MLQEIMIRHCQRVDLSGIKVNSDNDIVNLLFIGNDHRKEWNGFVEEGLPDVMMMIGTLDKNINLETYIIA